MIVAVYDPNYDLIAVFADAPDDVPRAETESLNYYRTRCSEFCMRRTYPTLAAVPMNIADED